MTVVLSRSALYIHSEEEDAVRSVFSLGEVTIGEDKNDPTLLVVRPTKKEEAGYSHVSDRVARFVLESIHFAETGGGANVGEEDGNQQCDNQVIIVGQPKRSFLDWGFDQFFGQVQLFMGSQARLDFCTIFKQVLKMSYPVLTICERSAFTLFCLADEGGTLKTRVPSTLLSKRCFPQRPELF